MDSTAIVFAVIAAAVSLIALFFTGLAAVAAFRQTKLQHQMRKDAAQPYIWVDIRPNDEHAGLLMLYLGNSGPTVATSVKVTFLPSIDLPARDDRMAAITLQLSTGIAALPPGRTLQWSLGSSFEQLELSPPQGYLIKVDGCGPFGPIGTLEYTINLHDIKMNLATPPGTLNGVAVAIDKSTKKIVDALKASG